MVKKILVIRFSSIGDIVLTTPIVRALHLQLGAEVHYLTKPVFAPMLLNNPHVAKVITLPDNYESLIGMLKKEQYDYIIDLHHNLRTQRIKLSLRRHSSSFPKLNFEKWMMVNLKINRMPELHIVDRYFKSVEFLNVQNDGKGLDFFIPPDKKLDVFEKFAYRSGSYASIVISATYNTKCLTANQIAELCEILSIPIILLGGKQDIGKADEIISKTKSFMIKSACGIFELSESASILDQSAAIISHDTGLMHVAAALKKPQVVIWGNTIPAFGMYPYYGNENIKWISFEQMELKCRPCTKLGFDKCPKGHFKCILDHDVSKIAEATKSLLT